MRLVGTIRCSAIAALFEPLGCSTSARRARSSKTASAGQGQSLARVGRHQEFTNNTSRIIYVHLHFCSKPINFQNISHRLSFISSPGAAPQLVAAFTEPLRPAAAQGTGSWYMVVGAGVAELATGKTVIHPRISHTFSFILSFQV